MTSSKNLSATASSVVERLESRTLFASSVVLIDGWSISVTSKGTLLVQGDANANAISLRKEAKSIAIGPTRGDSQQVFFSTNDIKRVYVDGGAGKDNITTVGDFGMPVTVLGGAGNDTIRGGSAQTLSGGDGNDVITAGGPSFRIVQVGEDGNITITIGESAISPFGTLVPIYTFEYVELFDTVKPSLIFGGAGDDVITTSGAADTISGGGGRDELRLRTVAPIDFNEPIPGGSLDGIELISPAMQPSTIVINDGTWELRSFGNNDGTWDLRSFG